MYSGAIYDFQNFPSMGSASCRTIHHVFLEICVSAMVNDNT